MFSNRDLVSTDDHGTALFPPTMVTSWRFSPSRATTLPLARSSGLRLDATGRIMMQGLDLEF
jgi:hypothetical protein